ncbi:MAG: hypothetical protein K5930_12505 [Treponemataceae bacterium]|nr:hypothetical protein [Treponemataceae bacterium]
MKAKITFIMAVLLFLTMACIFAEETMTTEEFLESYEKFVESVEEAAETGNYAGYAEFLTAYNDFLEDYAELDSSEWTYTDIMLYSELTNRYNIAVAQLAESMSTTPTLDDYSALMGAYADIYSSYGF